MKTPALLLLSLVLSLSTAFAQDLLPYEVLNKKKKYYSYPEFVANIDSVFRADVSWWPDSQLSVLTKAPNLQELIIGQEGNYGDAVSNFDYSKLKKLQVLKIHLPDAEMPTSVMKVKHLSRLSVYGIDKFPDDLKPFKKLDYLMPSVPNEEQIRIWDELKDDVEFGFGKFYKTYCNTDQPWNGYFTSFDVANKYKDQVLRFRVCGKKGLERIAELKNYPNIELLVIYDENLDSIPPTVYELTSLTELRIYHCKLAKFQEGISNLQNLKKLNIGTNSFPTIPDDFYDLVNLEEVYFEECINLTSFSDDIKKMKSLKKLMFGIDSGGDTNGGTNTTPISKIPAGVYEMESLEVLGLSCTNVTEFPDDLKKIKTLKGFTINFFIDEVADQLEELRKRFGPDIGVY